MDYHLQIELFHHSTNVPATISKLVALLDKGTVVKQNPRYGAH
jgi:elongation factor 1 alpha-like protein